VAAFLFYIRHWIADCIFLFLRFSSRFLSIFFEYFPRFVFSFITLAHFFARCALD